MCNDESVGLGISFSLFQRLSGCPYQQDRPNEQRVASRGL